MGCLYNVLPTGIPINPLDTEELQRSENYNRNGNRFGNCRFRIFKQISSCLKVVCTKTTDTKAQRSDAKELASRYKT